MSSSQNNPLELLAMDEARNESLPNRGSDSIRGKSFKSTLSDSSNDNIIYEKDDYLVPARKEEEESISYCGIKSDDLLACILNVITSALGQGCLSFPYILQQLGLYLTIIIFILVNVSVYFANDLLRSFVVDTKNFSFALMTNEILGKTWLKIYAVSSLIYYSVVEINYLSVMHKTFAGIVQGEDTENKIGFGKSSIYLVVTLIIEVLVCSYVFNPKKIHLLSLITIVCFLILLSTIIIVFFINLCRGTNRKFTKDFLYPSDDPKIILNTILYINEYVYGYSYNSSYPTLLGNLKNIDNNNSKKVHIYSFLGISSLYVAISFFGYLIYSSTPETLFQKMTIFDETEFGFLDYFCKSFLWVYLFTVIPMRFIVVRDNYSSLVKGKMTSRKDFLVTFIFIFLFNLIVFSTNENDIIQTLVGLFGGIFGIIIGFYLPVINYAAVNGKKKLKSIIGYILIGFYGIVGLISFGYYFVQLIIALTNLYKE